MQLALPIALVAGGALLGGVAAKALAPKAPTTASVLQTPGVKAPPIPTPTMAADQLSQSDAFRRRRGAAANELTGGGAEAPSPGAKTLLGQ
jgi:hypothetical protein